MTSLVLELQRDSLDNSVSTSTLLRKALVVAKKLKISDIEHWINSELNGYEPETEAPSYRTIHGQIKVFNPYNGWIPLHFSNPDQAEALSQRVIKQSIVELENIVNSSSGGSCYIRYPKSIEIHLMKSMEIAFEPALMVSATRVRGMVDRVRNIILDWSLKLEENGVLGEGMTFTSNEKEKAESVVNNYNIKNVIGSMNDSQIQQDSDNSNQAYTKSIDLNQVRKIIDEIVNRAKDLKLNGEAEIELKTEIECISSQLNSPKPKIEVIKECLKSVRTIVEGASGSALFEGVKLAITSML